MRRRDFIAFLGSGLGLYTFLRHARADIALDAPTPNPTLGDAYAAALKRGVALLVIVIPAKQEQWWDRGTAWGALLNHGSAEDLAPLARVEVACAPMQALAKYGVKRDSDPTAVLIPTNQKSAGLFFADLPPLPGNSRLAAAPPEAEVVARRMAALGQLVRNAVGEAPRDEARTLSAVVHGRIVKRPPPGSHWANASGCGSRIESTPEELAAKEHKRILADKARARGEHMTEKIERLATISCGMGSVPELSRRFLWFYTDDNR